LEPSLLNQALHDTPLAMRRCSALVLLTIVAVSGVGCSGGAQEDEGRGQGPSADSSGGAPAGEISCGEDPRVDSKPLPLRRDGDRESVEFELLETEPAPPARGDNRLRLRLTSAGGEPLLDAAIRAVPTMPDHGHGTPIKPEVSAVDELGTYDIEPLNLFMPGVWRISFEVANESESALDSAAFWFCIAG